MSAASSSSSSGNGEEGGSGESCCNGDESGLTISSTIAVFSDSWLQVVEYEVNSNLNQRPTFE